MIYTITELIEQPGVQKALESSIVKKQLGCFNRFLESFFVKVLNKWTTTIKRYLKWSNLILINLVVLSYQAGKVHADEISEWLEVFVNFDVWWSWQIVVNLFYVIGRFLRTILEWCLRIAIAVLIFWMLYKVLVWVINLFRDWFSDDTEIENDIQLKSS